MGWAMAFAGIDISDAFPGDHTMRALKINTNLSWVGLYLAETDQDKQITKNRQTWVGQFMPMKAMGWGVAPIYVGKQVAKIAELLSKPVGGTKVGVFEGGVDGQAAVTLASNENLPQKTIIYFDLEAPGGTVITDTYWDYLASWSRTLLSMNYLPGIYCSSMLGEKISTKMETMVGNGAMSHVWIADTNKHQHDKLSNPFPADQAFHPNMSGFAKATAWQYVHHRPLRVDVPGALTVTVDFNSAVRKDPGRPAP